jgi:hypothetical protein
MGSVVIPEVPGGHAGSAPSVILSPNARNLVALKIPGRVTVREKLQDADFC